MNKYKEDEMLLMELQKADNMTIKSAYDKMEGEFTAFILKYFSTDLAKAKEIYPESFAKFYFNIKNGKLSTPLRSSLKTYLFAIGKRLFLKNNYGTYQKKISLTQELPEIEEASSIINHYEYDAQKKLVQNLLDRIGDKCKELLTLIYIMEMESNQILQKLNISSLGTMRKRKFDCMQKMRTIYKSQAD